MDAVLVEPPRDRMTDDLELTFTLQPSFVHEPRARARSVFSQPATERLADDPGVTRGVQPGLIDEAGSCVERVLAEPAPDRVADRGKLPTTIKPGLVDKARARAGCMLLEPRLSGSPALRAESVWTAILGNTTRQALTGRCCAISRTDGRS